MSVYLWWALAVLSGSNSQAQVRSEKPGPPDWLLGTWEMKTIRGTFYEIWITANDSTLQGKSFKVTGKDTVVLERLEVSYRKRKFYYTSTVSGQNNEMPVSFQMTLLKDDAFIAENPQHDFPQRIGYRRTGNTLDAWIDGKANGKYAKQAFRFSISP